MQRMHDPDGFRRLERELRESAERTRRTRESRASSNDDLRTQAVPVELEAPVLELPVRATECRDCDLEREETSA
jgi:hypothetical protein